MDLNSKFVIIVLFHNTQALLVLKIQNWQNIFTFQIHTQTNPISKWRLHTILLNLEFKNTKLITTTNNSIIIITFVIYHYQRHHQHQQHYHDTSGAGDEAWVHPLWAFYKAFPWHSRLHRREGLPNPPQIIIKKENMIDIFVFMIQDDLLIIAGTSSPIRTAKFQPGRRRGREAGGTG